MGEIITLTAGEWSATAGVEFGAPSRVYEWEWGTAEPKRTVAAGATGGLPVGAAEYDNVTSTFRLERTPVAGDGDGEAVDWIGEWEAVCHAASRLDGATLTSELADGRTVTWLVERASVKATNRGDIVWTRGIATLDLTVVHSPVGEGEPVEIPGALTTAGSFNVWTATDEIPGHVPALLDVEVDNLGKRFGATAWEKQWTCGARIVNPPDVVWSVMAPAAPLAAAPPGASDGATVMHGSTTAGDTAPLLLHPTVSGESAGVWRLQVRAAAFGVDSATRLTEWGAGLAVELAVTVDGDLASGWHEVYGGDVASSWPTDHDDASAYWRLVDFGQIQVPAGAKVCIVGRGRRFTTSGPSRFNFYLEKPVVIVDADVAATTRPVVERGSQEAVSLRSALTSGGSAPTVLTSGTEPATSPAVTTAASTTTMQWTADGGKPASGVTTAIAYVGPASGSYQPGVWNESSIEFKVPAGASGLWRLAFGPWGDRDTSDTALPGTIGAASAFNGLAALVTDTTVYAAVSDGTGWGLSNKSAPFTVLRDVWYRVALESDASGLWRLRIGRAASSHLPVVLAGQADVVGSSAVQGVPRVLLQNAAVVVRSLSWATFNTTMLYSAMPSVWSATGRTSPPTARVEGGLPTAEPGSKPIITFRRVGAAPYDPYAGSLGGGAFTVTATPRYLSVPGAGS